MSYSRRSSKKLGKFIDVINIIIAVAIVALAAFIGYDVKSNVKLFPILFFCAMLMNLIMGIKFFKRGELLRASTLFMATIALLVMTILSYMTTWQ